MKKIHFDTRLVWRMAVRALASVATVGSRKQVAMGDENRHRNDSALTGNICQRPPVRAASADPNAGVLIYRLSQLWDGGGIFDAETLC